MLSLVTSCIAKYTIMITVLKISHICISVRVKCKIGKSVIAIAINSKLLHFIDWSLLEVDAHLFRRFKNQKKMFSSE